MKWLCNFLKGTKPEESSRRRPRLMGGEQSTHWQHEPIRPKVRIPSPCQSLIIFLMSFFHIFMKFHFMTHVQFSATFIQALNVKICRAILKRKPFLLCYFQREEPPRPDNEELDRQLALSLAEDAKHRKGTSHIHVYHVNLVLDGLMPFCFVS